MNTHSSGYYSIDEEYTIIGFNDTAKEIYPNLQKGIKCYKAFDGTGLALSTLSGNE